MMRDRGDDDALPITQDLLAEMLGVQRPTITNAARELERAGLIARGRRQVTILNRQGLTKASCECYQLVRTRLTFHLPKHTQKNEQPTPSVMYITDNSPNWLIIRTDARLTWPLVVLIHFEQRDMPAMQ
jgi:DNA-binding transcriptional regulator YhcF (GntR family)